MTQKKLNELAALVQNRIENLRPKLLDFGRRNPLISTSLGGRSGAYVRVVDELPDILFYKLTSGDGMRIIPLPPLADDPRDESEPAFTDALAVARRTDELYIDELEKLDPNSDEYLDRAHAVERTLKDRIREQLSMSPRQTRENTNYQQHAKNHGITPSYDLPEANEEHEDGRHTDNDIQALMLPKDLERRLNSIIAKDRSFAQETGINVLHGAFGFLEWTDPNSQQAVLSPLILMPVKLERKKAKGGFVYWVSETGDRPELNGVLSEKFLREFGIELPPYDGDSIEDYLKTISEAEPDAFKWRVRRFVVFGVFPSARMAMYYDLDTGKNDFSENEAIRLMFAGAELTSTSSYADEYEVDHPDIECKVPLLVKEADASQFSALVDIAYGKNLAIEGPPGTGKSQTIVNAIAAAMAAGKKVLFVAEKAAALEVVQSRLEACGLSDFVLPLIAGRASRQQVIVSLRERIDMEVGNAPREYLEQSIRRRKVRDDIAEYINVISKKFGETELTVQEILGKSIATSQVLQNTPDDIRFAENISRVPHLPNKITDILEAAQMLTKFSMVAVAEDDYWKGTEATALNRFHLDRIVRLAEKSSKEHAEIAKTLVSLERIGITDSISLEDIKSARLVICNILREPGATRAAAQADIMKCSDPGALTAFFETCEKCQKIAIELEQTFVDPTQEGLLQQARELYSICKEAQLQTLDISSYRERITKKSNIATTANAALKPIHAFCERVPEAINWQISDIEIARKMVLTAGHDALLHRRDSVNEPGYPTWIRKICNSGKVLATKRTHLSSKFVFAESIEVSEIADDLTALKSSGVLGSFSGNFRQAKNRYLSISKRSKFKKSAAIIDLAELAEFKLEEAEFLQNSRNISLFGLLFDGLNTPFDQFERLAQFYDDVDNTFVTAKQKSIQNFLKTGNLDHLTAIPHVTGLTTDKSVEVFSQNLEEIQGMLDRQILIADEIEPLLNIFVESKNIQLEDLDELAGDLVDFKEWCRKPDTDTFSKSILGESFKGWRTASEDFKFALGYVDTLNELGTIGDCIVDLTRQGQLEDKVAPLERVIKLCEDAGDTIEELAQETGLNTFHFTNERTASQVSIFLDSAASDMKGLQSHSRLAAARKEFAATGFDWLVGTLLKNNLDLSELRNIVEAVIFHNLSREVYDKFGDTLVKFNGQNLNDLRKRFVELDREIHELSQKNLRAKLSDMAKPPYGIGTGRKSEYTDLALIKNEVVKKKRHIPVRELTRRAAHALLELKPCWMMSPLAVAQYIDKNSIEFDLCIIDEASQMPPEDAIGALVRSRQTIVVGDTNQLPPTNFFRKMLDDDYEDEDETTLEESILEMANATFRPMRRLRWHYRSRHSGLIKFSNRIIYDDDLIVFPSANEEKLGMGVSLVQVKGSYKSGLNPDEARVVVDAALEFMRKNLGRSLGIAALNKAQTDLIREELEHASVNDSRVSEYIAYWEDKEGGLERLFVKNLENVQGDERDVIFISTVYGPEKPGGPVMQRFGPINGLAGRRRLNVLFSRAKEQIITFSSMTGDDIKADEYKNPGAYMLKRWLEYSATGVLDGGDVAPGREPDSDFERYVIKQIETMGCEANPQVGVAGYFIDIGVKHPDWPHGFILGVECDGASYHSSKSARDRDRLRQEVMEGLGWRFHRIWSTDWFNDPVAEGKRLREVISARLKELKAGEKDYLQPKLPEVDKPAATLFEVLDAENDILLPPTAGKDAHLAGPERPISTYTEPQESITLNKGIKVGDKVRIKLLSEDNKLLEFTISSDKHDLDNGILHKSKPIASAILDMEEGDEIEYLVGSYVRKAIIEKVTAVSEIS